MYNLQTHATYAVSFQDSYLSLVRLNLVLSLSCAFTFPTNMLVINCLDLSSPYSLWFVFFCWPLVVVYSYCLLWPLFLCTSSTFPIFTKTTVTSGFRYSWNCSNGVSVSQAFLLTPHGSLATLMPCCEGWPKNWTGGLCIHETRLKSYQTELSSLTAEFYYAQTHPCLHLVIQIWLVG